MSQEQINRPAPQENQTTETPQPKDLSEKREELLGKADDLADDIDKALAEALGTTEVSDFVQNFVQRGGE